MTIIDDLQVAPDTEEYRERVMKWYQEYLAMTLDKNYDLLKAINTVMEDTVAMALAGMNMPDDEVTHLAPKIVMTATTHLQSYADLLALIVLDLDRKP